MRVVPYGLRPCKVRNLSRLDVVGNDPCVVPVRVNVTLTNQYFMTHVAISLRVILSGAAQILKIKR